MDVNATDSREVLIDGVYEGNTRVAVCVDGKLYKFYSENSLITSILGNIYIAKINKIDRGLEAVFVTYNKRKNGFLPFSEIHPIYHNRNIPFENKIQHIQSPQIHLHNIECHKNNTSEQSLLPYNTSEQSLLPSKYKLNNLNVRVGDFIIVQARKEERECKNASLTTFINLTGKYFIFLPNKSNNSGVSRRVTANLKRKSIKDYLEYFLENSNIKNTSSLIARTSSESATPEMLWQDYQYLCHMWNEIVQYLNSHIPTVGLIHREDNFLQRIVQNYIDHRTKNIIIEGKQTYLEVIDLIKNLYPEHDNKVHLYTQGTPIFNIHNLEEQILTFYLPRVDLNTGGYIVINPTEALTAIDVNSGSIKKHIQGMDILLKTNIEAAKIIGAQIRLRNISGLIIIDFIEMDLEKDKKEVVAALKKELSHDGVRTRIGAITSFGILEVSRQRSDFSLIESNTIMCSKCNGKGIIKREISIAILILNLMRKEINLYNIKKIQYTKVVIEAHSNIIVYLINHFTKEITNIKKYFHIDTQFKYSNKECVEYFSIEVK